MDADQIAFDDEDVALCNGRRRRGTRQKDQRKKKKQCLGHYSGTMD